MVTGLCLGPRGAYNTPSDPLVGFEGDVSRQGKTWKGGQGSDKGKEGGGIILPTNNSYIRHCWINLCKRQA